MQGRQGLAACRRGAGAAGLQADALPLRTTHPHSHFAAQPVVKGDGAHGPLHLHMRLAAVQPAWRLLVGCGERGGRQAGRQGRRVQGRVLPQRASDQQAHRVTSVAQLENTWRASDTSAPSTSSSCTAGTPPPQVPAAAPPHRHAQRQALPLPRSGSSTEPLGLWGARMPGWQEEPVAAAAEERQLPSPPPALTPLVT